MPALARLTVMVTILAGSLPPRLSAQLDPRIGPFISYGDQVRAGGGLAASLAIHRVRLGVRWSWQAGSSRRDGPFYAVGMANPFWLEVTRRVQLATLEVAVPLHAGKLRVEPELAAGVLFATQRGDDIDTVNGSVVQSYRFHAQSFLLAPGLTVPIPVGPLLIVPGVRVILAGAPSVPYGSPHGGMLVSLQLAWTPARRR